MHPLCNFLVWIFFFVCLVSCQGQSKEELVREGNQLMKKNNPLGAVVYFRNALEKDPNYIEARYQLAQAYLETDKLDQAKTELNKVYLQNPDNGDVLLDLSMVSLTQDDFPEAERWLGEYLDKHAKSSRSQYYLGVLSQHKGDTLAAERFFMEAIDLDEQYTDAAGGLARLYMIEGRTEKALNVLNKAISAAPENKALYRMLATVETRLGNTDAALDAYEKIIEIDPDDVGAYFFAGILSFDEGMSAGELKKYADIMKERFPDHPATARLQGILHVLNTDFESATVELRNSLKQIPDLSGYYFLGLAEYNLKHYEMALSQFQKALDLNPDHLRSRLLLGMTLLQQQRIDDCIYQISQVLTEDDTSAMAHNVMGTAYMAKGDYDKAAQHFDRAISLNPQLADPHIKKGLLNLSRLDLPGAEMELEHALGVTPEALNTRLLLASLYLKQQNFQGVIELLEPALDGSERDALLYNYMAGAYLAQKNIPKGIEALKNAKSAKSDYFAPCFNLANVYLLQKQPEKAQEEYNSILNAAPDNIKALVALAALQELQGDSNAALETYKRAMATNEARGFLALAGYYFRNRDSQQYVQVIDKAYATHPEDPTILELRARLKLGQKDFAAAIETLKTLERVNPEVGGSLLAAAWLASGEEGKALTLARNRIEDNPANSSAYLLLAAIQQRLQQNTEAEQTLQNGIARVDDARPLLLRLGGFYLSQKRIAEAEKIFRDLHRDSPEYIPATFALAVLQDQRGYKQEAMTLYRSILEKNEKHSGAMNNLAYLYAENNGDPEQALLLAYQAFRNEPSNPIILDTLGFALLKNRHFAEAVKVLEKASELLPDMPAVRLHQAQALIGAEDYDNASKVLEHVIELNAEPESIRAQELLDELKKQQT
jgi:putative PEP-CTERM system TPR-repeat lipoprotein